VLDRETALAYKKYCDDWEGDVSEIDDYDSLGEGAAEVLASIDDDLRLGLSTLSLEDAKLLAQNKEDISFSRLLTLDEATAAALAQCEGDLCFDHVLTSPGGEKILKKKCDYISFTRKLDEACLKKLYSDDFDHTVLLDDPDIVDRVLDQCIKISESEGYEIDPWIKVIYFSPEALHAIASHHPPEETLDFSWGRRKDTSGGKWDKRHIKALCVFRGDEIHLNSEAETLTPANLGLLSRYSLLLNSIGSLGDEYADALAGWEGSELTLEGVKLSPAAAAAIASSGIKVLRMIESPCNAEILQTLCASTSLNRLEVSLPKIGGEIAEAVVGFKGSIALNSRFVTREAASILVGASCRIDLFSPEYSCYADEETIADLEKLPGADEWEPTYVGEDELEWQDRCRLVLDLEKVKDEDFYSHEQYPRISNEALEYFVSEPECQFHLDNILVLDPGQAAILSKLEVDSNISLGVCELSYEDAQTLAGTRLTSIRFEKLDTLSDTALKAFAKRRADTSFNNQALSDKLEKILEQQSDEEDSEYESSAAGDVAFDLGRLRQRMSSRSSVMGGPAGLLDSIEESIKEKGYPLKDAQVEAWIGHFLVQCVNGHDTTETKQAILRLYHDEGSHEESLAASESHGADESLIHKCPWCAGTVKESDLKCQHCQIAIEWDDLDGLKPIKPCHMDDAEYIDLLQTPLSPELFDKFPARIAKAEGVVPVTEDENYTTVAAACPLDLAQLDNLAFMLKSEIKVVIASPSAIDHVLKEHYGGNTQSFSLEVIPVLDKTSEKYSKQFYKAVNELADAEHFYVKGSIPQKKLAGAVNTYLPASVAEDIIFMYDDTVFGGAKEGLCLTGNAIYFKEYCAEAQVIMLGDIDSLMRMSSKQILISLKQGSVVDYSVTQASSGPLENVLHAALKLYKSLPNDAGDHAGG